MAAGYTGLASGGMAGTQGPEIAMLGEEGPELVLNAKQTAELAQTLGATQYKEGGVAGTSTSMLKGGWGEFSGAGVGLGLAAAGYAREQEPKMYDRTEAEYTYGVNPAGLASPPSQGVPLPGYAEGGVAGLPQASSLGSSATPAATPQGAPTGAGAGAQAWMDPDELLEYMTRMDAMFKGIL